MAMENVANIIACRSFGYFICFKTCIILLDNLHRRSLQLHSLGSVKRLWAPIEGSHRQHCRAPRLGCIWTCFKSHLCEKNQPTSLLRRRWGASPEERVLLTIRPQLKFSETVNCLKFSDLFSVCHVVLFLKCEKECAFYCGCSLVKSK